MKTNATENLKKTTLRAEGFSCPSCVTKIEKGVSRLEGVSEVKVHFASSRIEVTHDPSLVSETDLVEQVKKAGYSSQVSSF